MVVAVLTRLITTYSDMKKETNNDGSAWLGHQLRLMRLSRGMTLEEVAAHLGITQTAYSKLERGQSRSVNFSYIRILAKMYKVRLFEMFLAADDLKMLCVKYGTNLSYISKVWNDRLPGKPKNKEKDGQQQQL